MITLPQDEAGQTEGPKTYDYDLEGNTLYAQREDPYGHFRLKLAKGKLPSKYTGTYTSTYEVEKIIGPLKIALREQKEK